MPPSHQGPLASFLPLLGREFTQLAEQPKTKTCGWMVDPVISKVANAAAGVQNVWTTGGDAWDTEKNSPVDLVILVDPNLRIVGFGFPGFKSTSNSQNKAGWKAVAAAQAPLEKPRAFAILKDTGSICPLEKRVIHAAEPSSPRAHHS